MITNLIKRHPNCRVLLHRTNMEDCTLTHDPYDLDEPDPADSHALESCLWELKVRHFSFMKCNFYLVLNIKQSVVLHVQLRLNSNWANLRAGIQYRKGE